MRHERNARIDVNPKVEITLRKHLARLAGESLSKEDLKSAEYGDADLVEMPVTKRMLPKHLHHLCRTYVVTARDEVLLYYLCLREQARAGTGDIGAFVRELSERSGVSMNRINRELFSRGVDEVMSPLVDALVDVSRERYRDPAIKGQLAAARKQKKRASR